MATFSLEPENEGLLTPFPAEKEGQTYGPEYTDTKSNRFALVLGDQNPGPDVLSNAIATGDQNRWKEVLKQREAVATAQRRNDLIREVASTRDPRAAPTPDELAFVQTLADDQVWSIDAGTVLEKQYSSFFTNTLSAMPENKLIAPALEENEDASLEVLDRASAAQERVLIAQDKLEEVNKKWESAGMFQKGVAFLKGVIPGYNWWKTADRIDEAPTLSLLSGNNLGEQIQYLYTLPPDEFKRTLDKAVDELADDNLLLAQQFAQAAISYSSSDQAINNFFDLVDVVDIATMGVTTAGKVLTSTGKLAVGTAKAGRAILRNPKNLSRQAAEVGMTRESAIASTAEDAVAGDLSGVKKLSDPSNPAALEERLPSLYSPQKAFTGKSTLEATATNRLRETILRSSELTKDFVTQGRLIDRLEPAQVRLAAEEAFDKIKDTFTNVNHHIIDTQIIAAEKDLLTNTAQAVVRFGKRDGSLFASEKSAQAFAKKYIGLKTDDFSIKQEGVGGFFIEIQRPLADVGKFRSMEIPTELKSSDSLSSQFLRNLRSPDYIVSEPNVRARGRLVHGQEMLAQYMQKITEPFRGKSAEWVSELDKVLKSNRSNRKYYQTVEEFEQNFLAINGKAPTEDQASAYFTYVQLNDLDYLIRDADIVKQKTRLGGEQIVFQLDVDGKKVSKTFDGIVRENLPYEAKSHFTVKVVQGGKEVKSKNSRFFGEKDRAEFDQLIKDGHKVVLDPSDSTYYLIKDFKRNRIPLGTLNRVEGGHNEYRYSHFIKQGDVKTGTDRVTRYRGDKSLFVTTTSKQAKEIADLFETARRMLNEKNPRAPAFIEDNLPIGYNEFMKKVATGDIRLDTPIMATGRGQRTADLHDYSTDFEYFDDVVSSEHNPFATVGGRYTTERADETLDVLLSENNIVVRSDLEPLLDPLETLRSSTANMLDVRIAHDYKMKSVQDWVQEFGQLIDAPINKVLANPGYYLQNPTWKAGANADRVVVANNARNAILQLQNYRDPVASSMQVWKDRVLSTVYEKGGEEWRAAVEGKLFEAQDVQTFLRGAAFNLKLGFFNPKQLFLQASASVNAVAIAGLKNGTAGVRALPLMRMMLFTENAQVQAGLFNKFGKLVGWEKNDFLSMMDSFKKSGFATVSNDVAYLDDFRPKTVGAGSKAAQVWSHHTDFFKEGELISRQVAYSAAWREFRDANPGKVVDRFAESKILARAKNMTTNMTRDSNAGWQKGWASVATQFMGYQARFMEQLWDGGLLKNGRKLTQVEKARLVVAMSTMYGIPVAGAATTAIPMRDMLRDWMNEQGVPYDDTHLEPFLDGIIPPIMEATTGLDMNWSEAYGPNGLPTISDLLSEDVTWYELLGGASGGVILDGMSRSAQAVGDLLNPGESSTWSIRVQDLIEPLKTISTVATADKLFEALNTHRYMSRNGTYLTDVSEMEAITSAIFGVNPDRVTDAYSQIAALKGSKEARQKYQHEAEKNFRLAIKAARENDFESYRVYKSRAWREIIAGGLSLSDGTSAFKRAVADEPMDKSVLENFERELQRRERALGKEE